MGRRGPHPAPTALKIVRGTRADRINDDEPVPSEMLVEPPAWLQSDAVEIWEHYAPDLTRKGVLTAWDVEAFGVCCDVAARRRKAVAAIASEGEIVAIQVFDKNGKPTGVRRARNPWLIVLNQADGQLRTWAGRFGLTPSDRAQIAGGDRRRDPHEDLLTG